ncbi:MAG: hypothetical protein KC506_01725, partial [Nanoarchaeota archaeon]|nr:hypothetical protein [Nanoarchaeota archaeon]
SASGITGNVISSKGSSLKSIATYAIAGVLLVSLMVFVMVKVVSKKKGGTPKMPKKMKFDNKKQQSEDKKETEDKPKNPARLEQLEKRLETIDKEINELREGDRIKKIESKINEREKLLQDLREHKDQNNNFGFGQ